MLWATSPPLEPAPSEGDDAPSPLPPPPSPPALPGGSENITDTTCLMLAERQSVGNQVSYSRSMGSFAISQGLLTATSFPERPSFCGYVTANSSRCTARDVMKSLADFSVCTAL